jgi:FdhD protein
MTVERGIETRPRRRSDPSTGALDAPELDELAVEAPLEIRLAGEPLATTMRTPGDDPALALGFLFAEGIVESARQVGTLAHCGSPADEGYGNVIEVTPGPGVAFDPERTGASRRGTLVMASCGVCGRASIDDLLARLPEAPPARSLSLSLLASAPEALASDQPGFARTGAVHAAAALTIDGSLLALAEDVGRHNAVDKVIGRLLTSDRLADAAILVVSGRTSFEIVQKAAVARCSAVVAVSGPTTLAVDLADRAGLVLAGFARAGRLNVYTHGALLR